MEYKLPTIEDEKEIREFFQEHFDHGEMEVIFSQNELLEDDMNWVETIQNNALYGNEEWGKSLLYLCKESTHILGILCIRYTLPNSKEKLFGNIGYGVRPSQRKKGYATKMLAQALSVCKEKGKKQIRIGCHKSNVASQKVIQKCGGIFVEDTEEGNRYYSIQL